MLPGQLALFCLTRQHPPNWRGFSAVVLSADRTEAQPFAKPEKAMPVLALIFH
jgi:hypothetical protein